MYGGASHGVVPRYIAAGRCVKTIRCTITSRGVVHGKWGVA